MSNGGYKGPGDPLTSEFSIATVRRLNAEDGLSEKRPEIESEEGTGVLIINTMFLIHLKRVGCYQMTMTMCGRESRGVCEVQRVGSPDPTLCIKYAARHGHLNCIKYMHQTQNVAGTAEAVEECVHGNNVDSLLYLVNEMKSPVDKSAAMTASSRGLLDCLRILLATERAPVDSRTLQMAICCGHPECAKMLHDVKDLPDQIRRV